jgi:hypothetical protein
MITPCVAERLHPDRLLLWVPRAHLRRRSLARLRRARAVSCESHPGGVVQMAYERA